MHICITTPNVSAINIVGYHTLSLYYSFTFSLNIQGFHVQFYLEAAEFHDKFVSYCREAKKSSTTRKIEIPKTTFISLSSMLYENCTEAGRAAEALIILCKFSSAALTLKLIFCQKREQFICLWIFSFSLLEFLYSRPDFLRIFYFTRTLSVYDNVFLCKLWYTCCERN